ncbi:unnamed protein product [Malus baccata var. baccata]
MKLMLTQGTIKLSGRELADIEKVLRVPKEDRHLGKLRPLFRKYGFQPLVSECQRRAMEKVGKKRETNAKKGKTHMLVPVDDILFHKGARKHWVRPTPKPKSQDEVLKIAALKKAKAKVIGCAATIVARDERRLLPHLHTINPIFLPTIKSTDQEGGPSCSRKRKYKEEVGNIHWKDLKVAMQPSSFRKMSKAVADAIRLKDENFESLKMQNDENVRLKKQLEATKEQLETTILEVSKMSIPTERDSVVQEYIGSQAFHDDFRPHIRVANFEKKKLMAVLERYDNGSIIRKYPFILVVDPNSDDDSDNEASISEQSQESEDPGDADLLFMWHVPCTLDVLVCC